MTLFDTFGTKSHSCDGLIVNYVRFPHGQIAPIIMIDTLGFTWNGVSY